MNDSERPAQVELDALRTELSELRAHVEALRSQLRDARGRIDLTMRGQTCCPSCGCTRIAHAMSILDRGESDSRRAMALYKPKWWSSKVMGQLEAYACTRCGLLEWYVKEPSNLEANDEYLRILEGSDPHTRGPYR